jgi:hypothetical protein
MNCPNLCSQKKKSRGILYFGPVIRRPSGYNFLVQVEARVAQTELLMEEAYSVAEIA